jgi:hypothetical protein
MDRPEEAKRRGSSWAFGDIYIIQEGLAKGEIMWKVFRSKG